MQYTGMIAGQATVFSAAQLSAYLQTLAGRVILQGNRDHCANAIIAHPGGNAAGGAINGVQYKGHAIYHESRNLGAIGGRCAVFFADSGNGHAKLLAVGTHIGGGVGHPVYSLDWVAQKWGGSARWQAGHNVVL
jgi:hypothetical protein